MSLPRRSRKVAKSEEGPKGHSKWIGKEREKKTCYSEKLQVRKNLDRDRAENISNSAHPRQRVRDIFARGEKRKRRKEAWPQEK